MCRLFAFVAPDASTAARELGPEGMESLRSLACLHGDGWGWAGIPVAGEQPSLRKSSLSAAADPDFPRALETPAHAAMVHLRWATAGLPVQGRNAHPFQVGGLSFEHNGSLKPIERVREMLSPETRAALVGDTDSEMYFALIREQIAVGRGVHDAVLHAVRRLREAFPLASLNAILLGDEEMVVVHASARSALGEDDLNEISRVGMLPDEHNEDYFALRWRRGADGAVMVGSTGVAGSGWEALPAESVTAIRLDDRSAVTVALDQGSASLHDRAQREPAAVRETAELREPAVVREPAERLAG